MTLKFIIDNYEIDLRKYRLEIVEENQWFSDSFFVRYSFPFEMDLTPDLDRALGMISNINSQSIQTIFEGDLYIGSEHHIARLEVQSIQLPKISVQVYYGFDDFPNFEKKLQQLNLARIDIENETPYQDIYALAAAYIDKNVDEVDFQFPKIIPPDDKYDTNEEKWAHFEGFVNNYTNGAFLKNQFNPGSGGGEQINRNVMHPMMYALALLRQGFEDAGYTLKGDVLQNEELKQMLVICENDFYTSIADEQQEMIIDTDDYILGGIMGDPRRDSQTRYLGYEKTITISDSGYYMFSGNFSPFSKTRRIRATLWVNDKSVYSVDKSPTQTFFDSFDVPVDIRPGEAPFEVRFTARLYTRALPPTRGEILEPTMLDMTISKISDYDAQGNLVPTLVDPVQIDLRKSVPDMTFGEYVKGIVSLYNYEMVPKEDRVIEINRITPKLSAPATVDLRHKEQKDPEREFTTSKTYLLQFKDVDNDDLKMEKVYITSNGYQTNDYTKDKDTEEIPIDLIPLPMAGKDGVYTAYDFEDDNNILKLARYDEQFDGNETIDPRLKMITIYERDYRDWIDFRIHSDKIKWKYTDIIDRALRQSVYEKVFAYNMEHLTRKITKKLLSNDHVEIEIETEA